MKAQRRYGVTSLVIAVVALTAPILVGIVGNSITNAAFRAMAPGAKGGNAKGDGVFLAIEWIFSPPTLATLAVVLALAGVGFGAIGLRSKRRMLAVSGVVLNLVVIFLVTSFIWMMAHAG